MDSNYFYSNPSIVETTTQVLFFVLVLHDCHIFSLFLCFYKDVRHWVKLISIAWFSWVEIFLMTNTCLFCIANQLQLVTCTIETRHQILTSYSN